MSYAGVTPEHWAEMLSASTGWKIEGEELITIGERVHNLQRLFNVREGFRRKDDHVTGSGLVNSRIRRLQG